MTGHIYRDIILEQHVRLFRGATGAEFLFMDDNACPHHANISDECLHSEDITRMDWPAYSPDFNPIEHVLTDQFSSIEKEDTFRGRTEPIKGELSSLKEDDWLPY
ncbi:transposable element Tcb2 transposase [Trichonephila clavipes]|nr:transposable element Tcb2 transposase [Trichonephila clavipes]